jgi:beta-N-acetylhexosaminidase
MHSARIIVSACVVLLTTSLAQAIWLGKDRSRGPGIEDIDKILDSMTLEEKVGQLLIVGFGGTSVTRHSRRWLTDRRVGGVALFSRNIKGFEQTARFARELHGLTKGHIPIFLALDQEGGNVIRVREGAMLLPGNMALGATREASLAYVAGQALGVDLRLLGFNMNLAPVLDVNSNPKNPVIGIRSYGERPELVAKLGAWYVRGQQEMGLVAVAKHFPGHGDTQSDSHFSMPAITADLNRLDAVELAPFKKAIEAGLDAVMTAHIALPQVTGDRELPATLSKTILTDLLRKRLGFEGIVITDGLEMQGIVKKYGSGRAAVLAVLAGADMPMILWTRKVKEEVYQALLKAVEKGELSHRRLDQSVRRILKVKINRKLFKRRLPALETVLAHRNKNVLHDAVAQRIAREAITLVRNHGELLPLRPERYRNVLVMTPAGALEKKLKGRHWIDVMSIPYVPNRQRRRELVAELRQRMIGADVLVGVVANRYHVDMLNEVSKHHSQIPVVGVSLSSPYYLDSMKDIDAYVCTYSYLDVAQNALAGALLGEFEMKGRLPVTLPGYYAYGHSSHPQWVGRVPASPPVAGLHP